MLIKTPNRFRLSEREHESGQPSKLAAMADAGITSTVLHRYWHTSHPPDSGVNKKDEYQLLDQLDLFVFQGLDDLKAQSYLSHLLCQKISANVVILLFIFPTRLKFVSYTWMLSCRWERNTKLQSFNKRSVLFFSFAFLCALMALFYFVWVKLSLSFPFFL